MNCGDEKRILRSALQAAEEIRRKKVSSLELTRLAFARLDRYNPRLNAFTYQMREEAMQRARECDQMLAHGEATGLQSTEFQCTSRRASGSQGGHVRGASRCSRTTCPSGIPMRLPSCAKQAPY